VSPRSGGPRQPLLLRVGVLAGAVILLLCLGCSYAAEEPGLFDRTAPSRGGRPSSQAPTTAPATNPELPVLADAVWTSADGVDATVRIGVHAVRRIDGATVLDWSVTPLAVPNLRVGDPVPPVDLGLSVPGDDRPRIYLLDAPGERLYRPLVGAAGPPGCVCTPLSLAERRLRIGHTTLLQVAFPALPAASSTIDVAFPAVAPFWRVPVTPIGRLPMARRPIELARPDDAAPPTAGFTDMFRYGTDEQVFRIQAHRVIASRTFATLEWTIWSVTGGSGLEAATSPPFAEPGADGPDGAGSAAASGPVLIMETERGGQTLQARLVRSYPPAGRAPECLCTPLAGWTALLARPDKPVTVMTTYSALPAGVQRVQVRWPDLGALSVPVTKAADARRRAAADRPGTTTTWRSEDLRTGTGWTGEDWPTPVPAEDELPGESGGSSEVLVR
jgi:hypothetical protein